VGRPGCWCRVVLALPAHRFRDLCRRTGPESSRIGFPVLVLGVPLLCHAIREILGSSASFIRCGASNLGAFLLGGAAGNLRPSRKHATYGRKRPTRREPGCGPARGERLGHGTCFRASTEAHPPRPTFPCPLPART